MSIKRVFIIFLLVLTLLFFCIDNLNNVYAFGKDEVKGILTDGSEVDQDVSNKITKTIKVVLDVIRIVGFGISMIMVVSFGIKYMVTMPAERAQMMKQSMIYMLGALLLFGASFLVGIVSKVIVNATE